jgi:diguanylate cyclase (GGDEF)-like protein
LIYIDLDGLAWLNAYWGFQVGDAALCRVARTIRRRTPWRAKLYRVEGDRFAVLLRGGDAGRAAALADGLRSEIAAANAAFSFTRREEEPGVLTATLALVHWSRNTVKTRESLLRAAGELVKLGKREGGNRVVRG